MLKKHKFDFALDTAAVFRLLLECFANPGRKNNLAAYGAKLEAANPLLLAIALVLLDNETTCYTHNDRRLEQEILELTNCGRAAVEEARYIIVPAAVSAEEKREILTRCPRGSFESPHESATIIVYADQGGERRLALRGPGIQGRRRLLVSDEALAWVREIGERDFEYPLGADLIALSSDGEMFCVPRLVKEVA
ncbi:MAG: phosphonate C-P lyase system protein PhnH [Peptococcaceae bacterium]|jgi:alpha-D-ribose 1-methylphosphonate 5-triphosphate synthase subunit PhnH|nr:phosphonate C-P lyase system protein PhnH [Peptococcaceae bacterium]